MGGITTALASQAEGTAVLNQAGAAPPSSSLPTIHTSADTKTGTKSNNILDSKRPNKKRKITTGIPIEENDGAATPLPTRSPHQNNTVTVASSSRIIPATAIELPASHAKPKPKPKTKAGKISKSNAAKQNASSTSKSSEIQALANESAATEMKLVHEVDDAADDAERQLEQHAMGWHQWRDPYGLASQPYLMRGEAVPWWGLCKMCEEGERGGREGGACI